MGRIAVTLSPRNVHTNLFALLKSPAARRFFIANFQSELGNGGAYVALVLIAYHRLHSPWAIALVLVADFVPGIVFAAPFGASPTGCRDGVSRSARTSVQPIVAVPKPPGAS
jgi:hypothetical protein